MTVYQTLCNTAHTLPENLQIEVLHYMNYLQEKFSPKTTRANPVQTKNEWDWLDDIAKSGKPDPSFAQAVEELRSVSPQERNWGI